MKLISTRDTERNGHSYTDVLLAGLAPDGGLYIPDAFPTFSSSEIEALRGAPYTDIAFAVKRKLVGGAIPDSTLRQLIDRAYAPEIFKGGRAIVSPVTEIGAGMYLQNLSLGP
ncbi:MAG TPA: threonine synthase, partial [Candidatus Paceibacterota bacterium]